MMFSKACEYGIKSCIFLARSRKEESKGVAEIAFAIHSPEAFTAKILQTLKREKIIDSKVGAKGGYFISQEKLKIITLDRIVNAIDGESIYKGCALGLEQCSDEKPCPVHGQFLSIRNDLKEMLESTHLSDLAMGLKNGFTFLRH